MIELRRMACGGNAAEFEAGIFGSALDGRSKFAELTHKMHADG
jgi:hypothetical protein